MPVDFLYKYRPLNANTIKILTNNELYFSSPLDFNDPFDCKVPPATEGTDDQWREYLEALLKKRNPEWPDSQIKNEAILLMSSGIHRDPQYHKQIRQSSIDLHKNTGILSLSAKNDDILMWSHYADSHRGLCVEFRHDKSGTNGLLGLEVKYRSDFPMFSIFDPDYKQNIVEYCLLTKADQWTYEEEYRFIVPNGKGPRTFDADWLTGIVFGCQMEKGDKAMVRKVLKGRRVKIYEAQMKERDFGLNIVPVA